MLRILYAASNKVSSQIQLNRFLKSIDNSKYIVKVAAYKISSPIDLNIDWTLDCLHYLFHPDKIDLDNEYFEIYLKQIKEFKPDLIISDLEYFTSYAANLLKIPLWQYSSSLIQFALSHEQKYSSGLYTQFNYLYKKDNKIKTINDIINMSNKNFVCSHLADLSDLKLKDKFEFIRPYNIKGKKSKLYEHNLVAASLRPSKEIINFIRKYEDSILFSEFNNEQYENLLIKEIRDIDEYTCNISNCNIFACEGQTSFLADAFYNNKFSIIIPDYTDLECIINSFFSEHFKIGKKIQKKDESISSLEVDFSINENITYLHERIDNELRGVRHWECTL